MTILDPAVTARIGTEGPELRKLRSELSESIDNLKIQLEALEACMAEEHARFAVRYTSDINKAAEYVAAAWRNMQYAQMAVVGQ